MQRMPWNLQSARVSEIKRSRRTGCDVVDGYDAVDGAVHDECVLAADPRRLDGSGAEIGEAGRRLGKVSLDDVAFAENERLV